MTKKIAKKKQTRKPKKSELDDLVLTDGKIVEDPDIVKVRELEEVLGIRKLNPFGTSNLEIFKERLNEMTNVDLQHLCEKIGIFASGSRQDIKQKLIREFKSTNKGTISMMSDKPVVQLDPNDPQHQKTIKILGEI